MKTQEELVADLDMAVAPILEKVRMEQTKGLPGMQVPRTTEEFENDARVQALGQYLAKNKSAEKLLSYGYAKSWYSNMMPWGEILPENRFNKTPNYGEIAKNYMILANSQVGGVASAAADMHKDPEFARVFMDALDVYDGNPETGDKGSDLSNPQHIYASIADPANLAVLPKLAMIPGQASKGAFRSAILKAIAETGKAGLEVAPAGAAYGAVFAAGKESQKTAAGRGGDFGDILMATAKGAGAGAVVGAGLGATGHVAVAAVKTAGYRSAMAKAFNGVPNVESAIYSEANNVLHMADAAAAKANGTVPVYEAARQLLDNLGLNDVRVRIENEAINAGGDVKALGSYMNDLVTLVSGKETEKGHEIIHAFKERMSPEDWNRLVQHPLVQRQLGNKEWTAKAEEALTKVLGEKPSPAIIEEEAAATALRGVAGGETNVKMTKFQELRDQFVRAVGNVDLRSPEAVASELQRGVLGERYKAARIKAMKARGAFPKSVQEVRDFWAAREAEDLAAQKAAAVAQGASDFEAQQIAKAVAAEKTAAEIQAGIEATRIERFTVIDHQMESLGQAMQVMRENGTYDAFIANYGDDLKAIDDAYARRNPDDAELAFEQMYAKGQGDLDELKLSALSEKESLQLAKELREFREKDMVAARTLAANKQATKAEVKAVRAEMDALAKKIQAKFGMTVRVKAGEPVQAKYSLDLGETSGGVVDEMTIPRGTYRPGKNFHPNAKGADKGQVRTINWARMVADPEAAAKMAVLVDDPNVQYELYDRGTTRTMTNAEVQAKAAEYGLLDAMQTSAKFEEGMVAMAKLKNATATTFMNYLSAAEKAEASRSAADILVARELRILSQELAAQFMSGSTAVARSLNILKAFPKTDSEAMSLLARMGKDEVENELVMGAHIRSLLKDAKDPKAALRYARMTMGEVSQDALWYIYRNSLMSGIGTTTATLTSSALAPVLNVVESAMAGLVSAIPGYGSGTVSMAESLVAATAGKAAIPRALGAMGRVASGAEHLVLEGHEVYSGNPIQELAMRVPIEKEGLRSAISTAGWLIGTPSRFSQAADQFAGLVMEDQAVAQMVMRKAKAMTKNNPADFDRVFAEMMSNPVLNEQEVAEMTRIKHDLLLRGDMTVVGKYLSKVAQEVPALKAIVPFIRTPDNVFKFLGTRNPVTAWFFKDFQESIASRGARRDRAVGALVLGTGTISAAGFAYYSGLITGRKPTNANEVSLWELENKQEYSVKIGNKWVSYRRADPYSALFGLAADTMQLWHQTFDTSDEGTQSEHDIGELFAGTAGAFSAAFMAKNTTMPLLSFLDGMNSGDGKKFDQALSRMIGSVSPTILADIAKQLDPHIKETNGLLDGLYARLPGMRDDLPNRYDVLGRVKSATSGIPLYDMIMPFPIKDSSDRSPFENAALANQWNLARLGRKVTYGGVPVDLSKLKGAYAELSNIYGTIKLPAYGNRTAHEALNAIVSGKHVLSRTYNGGTPGANGTQEMLVRQILGHYRQAATLQLLAANKDVQAEYQAQQANLAALMGANQ